MKLEISIDKKKFLRFLSIVAGIIIFFVLFSGGSKAESGTISVTSETDFPYYTNTGVTFGGTETNMSYLVFDTTSYSRIIRFRAVFSTVPSITPTTGYTTFTIKTDSGNSGHGNVYFDAATKNITWLFSEDTYLRTSPVVLIYANTSIFSVFSATPEHIPASYTNIGVDTTHPAYISTVGGLFPIITLTGYPSFSYYEALFVGTNTTISYNITYPVSGYYLANITKFAGTKASWIKTHSATVNQFSEGAYTLDNVNAMNETLDGIYINVTMQAGGFTDVLINSSGVPGFVPPAIPPTVDPLTGVGITFDANSYNIGGTANISWIRNNPTPFGYQDDIYLIQPTTTGSTVKKILVSSPQDTGFIKTNDFPIAGKYNVTFERSILGLFPELLDSDTATISAEQASYILVNETVPVGVYISGTYLAGWSGVGRIVIYQDMPDGTIKEIDSLAINGTCCIEFAVFQLFFPEAGNYRVVLMKGYDTVRATVSVVSYFTDIIPGANITVSNISLNKNQYTYGEPYTITYQVDDVNYSNKAKRIIAYEIATGANTLVNQVPTQTGTITRTFDSEMYPFSGALQLRLMGLNATGDYLLAYVNFTLSKIDTEGYGLDVTKSTICTKETGYFTYYSPSPVNIQISDKDVTVYSKNFSSAISGKTVPFTINRVGNYEIFLRVSNGTDVKFTKIVEVKTCEVTTTPGFPGQNGTWTPKQDSIAPTCNFWDGWVQLIFGVQGVNDVTRFQFALILIVVPMVGVVIITKSVGSGIAVGFIPYTFFAFLSLSTPCGTYMPTWTVIFIALVIGIKMRWFS